MDTELRAWSKLDFRDPEPLLRRLRELEYAISGIQLPARVRSLRTNELNSARQMRDAALFAHGMASATGRKIFFACREASDYDFVTRWRVDGVDHYCPVQLKEIVPEDLNAGQTLAAMLASLGKYQDTRTILAVLLNKPGVLGASDIPPEARRFKQMWLYWLASPDGNNWKIQGDALTSPETYSFQYPEPEQGTA